MLDGWEAEAGQPDIFARNINELALFHHERAEHGAAEPLYRRALAIGEQSHRANHPNAPNAAILLNNLATLLHDTNRLAQAEPLYRRALAVNEQSYGPNDPNVATDLNNLAGLLHDTNRLAEAEPLMRRALAIDEASYGRDHPEVANDLYNLANPLEAANRRAEVEPLLRRAVDILVQFQKAAGHEHPNAAAFRQNLRQLRNAQMAALGCVLLVGVLVTVGVVWFLGRLFH